MTSDSSRVTRLSTFFNNVIYDKRSLSTARDGMLFIEALCVQPDPASCAHKLLSSPSGLLALQASVRFDTSVSFLNGSSVQLLQYLQAPSLKSIDSGSVLGQLLLTMVEPPFFWEALTKASIAGILQSDAFQVFAWLLLQLISLPGKESSLYIPVASSPNVLDSILKSADGETRILGQKIKHALPSDTSQLHSDADAKPGGRHDNDHADFRAVSIMPTADELLSKERPFFRTADFIDDPDNISSRWDIHIDNQFRLLREDMLGEIRDEINILTGTKTGRHKGAVVDGLYMGGVEMGTDRRRRPWGLLLKLKGVLPHLKNIKPDKREEFLRDNRHILRQGSMACLLIDGEAAAYPNIHRDEEELASSPATITVQFADDPTLPYALSKMKTAGNIKLVQLDTAIFAFEPFLRRLQDKGINRLQLKDELIHWEEGKGIESPSFKPAKAIGEIELRSGKDLKDLLGLNKSTTLDNSQMRSLCACLRQRVSMVQGPPGKSFP